MTQPRAVELRGLGAAPGSHLGPAVLVQKAGLASTGRRIRPEEAPAEVERLRAALARAEEELAALEAETRQRLGEEKAGILGAQRMMLQDPALVEAMVRRITEEHLGAEAACLKACEEQAAVLAALDDPYLAERAADVRDVGRRVVRCLTGAAESGLPKGLPPGAVLVAEDLLPSETASLDVQKVGAIVLERGGRTSHTVLIARALGIPVVVGAAGITGVVADGELLLVDGDQGTVVVAPEPERVQAYQAARAEAERERERLLALRDLPGATRDGHRVQVAANIGEPGEVAGVLAAGAEGIGLFRTEFLFLHREAMPTEEEQFEAYRTVLEAVKPRPVIIRTLDIGGDKPLPYLDLPKEENPFLGVRAIRLCFREPELFRRQLRALLRASPYGNLWIMFPMISCLEELRRAKAELAAVREELVAAGVAVADRIPVGIMIETPAAAMAADLLARECDFFSIGTNDLVQYTMAADRGNPALGELADPFHPAVLRLIARTIEEGHRHGIPVGMCGDMAGQPLAIPLLVGMGIDELSMPAPAVLRAKDLIRRADRATFVALWERVRGLATAREVRSCLEEALAELKSEQ
ncbi:MAG: phosphoenolpyruvate--protein phosphotransferase [Firmicutes bacterium]|nr:phosphoenolpyruvate--protein phosphotransferase [Bacillota bacterium]